MKRALESSGLRNRSELRLEGLANKLGGQGSERPGVSRNRIEGRLGIMGF